MWGVATRATFFSSAATTSSGVWASFRAPAACPVTDWSVFSLSHFARSAALTASSSSRSIVVGAPWGFAGRIAIERPLAASRLKPIIVS